ncbi:PAS domain-containing protein [Rhizobium sp. NRK18]|uniref:PAS domain-containing protein n=1 Tax=Rhizobium sp. NRK18 TaxID=2964667 RepID=UPI0021C3448E|nr:PAS domain-containing protein [Rhizobium sp. NRK18]MCQ2004211.1 PAS domain-containing protein [Rhizobium sp. NRK18]
MDCKASIEIYQYWNRLRGQDAAPSRKQIIPSQIASVLPDLFILEEVAGGIPIFRLAGTRICELFGHELHGSPFTALWNGDNVINPGTIVSSVLRSAVPVLLKAGGYSYSLDTDETLEIPLLPLRSGGDQCDRILGSMSLVGPRTGLHANALDLLTLDRVVEIAAPRPLLTANMPPSSGTVRGDYRGERSNQNGPLFGQD